MSKLKLRNLDKFYPVASFVLFQGFLLRIPKILIPAGSQTQVSYSLPFTFSILFIGMGGQDLN